ncbi:MULTISPECIES: GntR family transcriptional regulator [Variovorax]|jgi:DNA-binding GntR family transcriptional regulator|uniref:DNA-binding GntR family transcriptional regulator n=1 Tax=Variovorax paradoxus TaxID=34073 RepID=A0AAE3Y2N4_VARPD|nr:GntR family transcriptional regulator [Variovorax paradoxus]MDR6428021.1 DNA-binding GntR family transcriptional regulator [Variovorax paradoxus]
MSSRTPTSAASKQQIAYEYIKSGIERGTFAPRQRLVLDTLARELSISKVPVREAVRRLEAEGLIKFSANSGAEVSGADPTIWFQLMELLAVLEGYATASAAANITAQDIKKLRAINSGMAKSLVAYDFAGWTDGNHEFHATINARCTNLALIEQMASLHARTSAIGRFVFHSDAAILHTLGPDSGKSALEAHEWLVAAFERSEQPVLIERHARDHILDVASRTLDLLHSPGRTASSAKASLRT